jgi:hypothetical protein
VEAHLAECESCREELESLERLSGLLQEVPAPEFTPSERFAAQVGLRLPYPKPIAPEKKVLEIGWWMIPVGLLGLWTLISIAFYVGDLLSVASSFGLLTRVSDWWIFGTSNAPGWSNTLGQYGVLSGYTLKLVASTETFTRTALPQISLQAAIALLYLSWIAIGWARHTRQRYGQALES